MLRCMARKPFGRQNCSVARAAETLGDGWSLLIVREALTGTRRFAHFEANLGIAKNVLTRRLQDLVENGVLERADVGQRGQRYEYRLTERGRDLFTVITALREWGDRWIFGEGQEPVVVRERHSGREVLPLRLRDRRGRELGPHELRLEPGPGATQATRRRFTRAPA